MLIKLKEGMKFRSKDGKSEFELRKWHYYDEEEIWCAFTGMLIYPLGEIYLDDYIPQVDGKWVNEKNQYIK